MVDLAEADLAAIPVPEASPAARRCPSPSPLPSVKVLVRPMSLGAEELDVNPLAGPLELEASS